jgi:GTP-binding protein
MTTPIIALIGRPNVGKSTLFNCLTQSRDAIVSDYSGLTRDRQYGYAQFEDKHFILIDTGGLQGKEQGIDEAMLQQTYLAIEEANIIFFMVDAKAGLMAIEKDLAHRLRKEDKKVFIVLNKIDGVDADIAAGDFHTLGLGAPLPIAAAHKRGILPLLEQALEDVTLSEELTPHQGVKLAIIGKPNVGKSTLVNRMLGEERVIVYDQPGTTRDSIFIPLERQGKHYVLIDTAGIRRKKNVHEGVEKFSIIKALRAVEAANVVIMVIDAREGITDQDLHLLGFVLDAGRSLLLAVNKWDGLDHATKQRIKENLHRRLGFLDFAKTHFISALHGTGVGDLFSTVNKVYQNAIRKHSSNKLSKLLEEATTQHAPPLSQGRRIKLRYAHPGGYNPPIIVIHGNQTDKLSEHYKRYLINFFRKKLRLEGTPIRLELRTGENPFAGIKNKLTASQLRKRKRLIKHVKNK